MKKLIAGLLAGMLLMGLMVLIGMAAYSQRADENRDTSKFGKYVITKELYRQIEHYTGTSLVSHKNELKAGINFTYHCLAKPISFDKPHSHKFHEILCFVGGNPLDITDFGAAIEYTIGDEKHILAGPGCVSMPPEQVHCPIVVKNVSREKPIVFIEVSLAPEYGTPTPAKQ